MRRASASCLPHLALIALLWLPFGVHMGPVLEEWGVLGLFAAHGPFLFAGADSLLPTHQMRPLMTTLWGLGYMVDPNSWWFWHLELAVLLLVKGISMSAIGMYLTGSRRWAVVAGLLFIVWPADTLQMAFRASPITLAAAATSASAALMVGALTALTVRRRVMLALLAAASLLAGSLSYELTLAFWPLPFLLIWAREGFDETVKVVRRGWQALAVWAGMAAACLGYIVWTLLSAKLLYQTYLVSQDKHLEATLVDHLPALFNMGVLRALITGWVEAVRIVTQDFRNHGYFFVVAAVIGCMVVIARGRSTASPGTLRKVALIGFGCVLLGYAPYLLAHLNTTDRTFMFAALGGTLFFLSLLVAIEKTSPATAAVFAIALLALGTAQQLWQFREYAALYERQREILKAIVEQAPSVSPGKSILILDESQQLHHQYMLADLIPYALTYLYGKDTRNIQVQVCFPQSGLSAIRDEALRQGTCERTPEGWLFRAAAGTTKETPDVVMPFDQIVAVRIGPDGKGVGKPAGMRDGSVLADRYRNLLQPDAWPMPILEETPGESYRWDFGRRWTMQDVIRGSGFSTPEWIYSPWRPTSGIWMNKPVAQLVFELGDPRSVEYQLTGALLAVDENIRASLKARVNGIEAPLHWITPLAFVASVRPGTVRKGSNIIEFQTAPTKDPWGRSVQFDWLDLSPGAR